MITTGRRGQFERLGKPVGIGQRRAGVAGLDPVVVALGARRVTGKAVLLTQRVELMAATGQHLVHIGLMASVEDDRIVG
jgi:class 3 adenylate cyclase